MRRWLFGLLVCTLAAGTSAARAAQAPPKGEIAKYVFDQSKIFPGTTREYWVYVPKQYDPEKPACVYVNQDGVQYKAPEVFDALIAKGEMPVTIGVFVMHGRVKATSRPSTGCCWEPDGATAGAAQPAASPRQASSRPAIGCVQATRCMERAYHGAW